MNRFCATNRSEAVVGAPRSDIWAALTDPVLLPKLTPLLKQIDTDGESWRWHLVRIAALGVSISPCFTERMTFLDQQRIEFAHESPPGIHERAGADGFYDLSDVDGGTRLSIRLTLCVELPLPRLAGPAVTKIMTATMERTGQKFSQNLLHHLGAHEVTPG
jgi:carbon monoxide dehydrogenase subunit G